MCTAEEKFFTPLTASEYRLLDVLCTLSKDGLIETKMEDLARFAQCSEESIRRALRGLETANLVETIRTKRNLGKLSFNRYRLVSPSHKIVGLIAEPSHKTVELPSHKTVGSTAVPGSSTVDIQSVPDTTNKLEKTTSSLVRSGARKHLKKAVVIVNKWSDEDDDIAGVGLFDNEVPSSRKPAKVSKRDPKTRHQRPKEEWTVWDVATEFSSRVYQILPGLPFPVDTRKVWGGITNARKTSEINPIIELEIMDMFFEDPWIVRDGMTNPGAIVPRFLKMLSTNFSRALKTLKLPELDAKQPTRVPTAERAQLVYASDGTSFDNSMFGRRMLQEHEEALNGISSNQS